MTKKTRGLSKKVLYIKKKKKEVRVDFQHTNSQWSLREKIAVNLIRCHFYGCAILMDKFYKILKR